MPVYCFRRKSDDSVVELEMSIQELSERQSADGCIILDDGIKAYRDFSEEHGLRYEPPKPIESDALGVHPLQVDEAEKHSVDHGVPVRFNKRTGTAYFENRQHRNDYIRMLNSRGWNIGDRDGGYLDPTD